MSTSSPIKRLKDEQRFLEVFGRCVRIRRLALDISQEDLAAKARVHRTYISDIERGVRNITLKVMQRLSKALNTTNSKLLRDVEGFENSEK